MKKKKTFSIPNDMGIYTSLDNRFNSNPTILLLVYPNASNNNNNKEFYHFGKSCTTYMHGQGTVPAMQSMEIGNQKTLFWKKFNFQFVLLITFLQTPNNIYLFERKFHLTNGSNYL